MANARGGGVNPELAPPQRSWPGMGPGGENIQAQKSYGEGGQKSCAAGQKPWGCPLSAP